MVLTLIAIVLVAALLYSVDTNSSLDIPGPSFLGFIYALIRHKGILPAVLALKKQYGPIFRAYIFTDVIITENADMHKFFQLRRRPDLIGGLLQSMQGNGRRFRSLLNRDGQDWEDMRKSIGKIFNSVNLKAMYPDMLFVSNSHIQTLKSGTSIRLYLFLRKLTMDVLGKVILDYDFHNLKQEDPLGEALDSVLATLEKRAISPIPYWNYLPKDRKLAEKFQYLEDRIIEIIEHSSRGNNLVSHMSDIPDITSADIYDEVLGFIIGGYESISSATTYFLECLITNPQIQKRLQSILLELPRDEQGEILYGSLMECVYLDACLKESMRFHTPFPFSLRELEFDTEFSGHIIPKGKRVIIMNEVSHRNAEYWDKPDIFDPERFLSNASNYGHYIPFGSGRRNCVGMSFAMVETKVIASKLLTTYSFSSLSGLKNEGIVLKRPANYFVEISQL